MVNIAIALGRPLLVEGEPGCGKTRLAHAIAEELGLGDPIKISVKSTTTAKELLYRVDSLARLHDAQRPDAPAARHVHPYLSLGPLGAAIHGDGRQKVVLIDEIDKADIDFPNDVLDVLEAYEFQIDELPATEEDACRKRHGFGRVVSIGERPKPIIVITSNREKKLPEPFLRRCLFMQLEFPKTEAELRAIVEKNVRDGGGVDQDALVQAAVAAFHRIRVRAIAGDAQKPPGTSELLDWVRILHYNGTRPKALADDFPPQWQLLFKTQLDRDNYAASGEKARRA